MSRRWEELRWVWKVPVLAVALIRQAVALMVKEELQGDPGRLDDSTGTELVTHSPRVI